MALTITQKPLAEVTATLSAKTPIGSALRSAEWANVPAQLRETAFFSAGVESARVLADAQASLQKILTLSRDPNGAISMDRGKFIAEMQKAANALGLRNRDPLKRGSVQDFGSERRLQLIFEQQIGQAQSKAYYLSGQDPDILDAWPAQELVRLKNAKAPRDWTRRWTAAGGKIFGGRMIALKTDPIWTKISRFGRPWPPFDYGSGMGLEEIDREEAESLGLIRPGETITPTVEQHEDELKASVKGLAPDMRAALQAAFGKQIKITNGEARWTGGTPPQPKPKPAPVVPPPAPAPPPVVPPPAPATVPPAAAEPQSVSEITPRLSGIAAEIEQIRASLASIQDPKAFAEARARLIALLAESRDLVSVPESERKAVTYSNKKLPPTIKGILGTGAEIVSRYIHPDLVPQGLTAKTIKGRAYYTPSKRAINVSKYDDPSVVAHEIAHAIEFSFPEISQATKQFLAKRADGQPAKSLSSLTGNNRYKSNERAYEDEWVARGGTVYSGKDYPFAATELLTVGIERLHRNPADFAAADPEYFEFVVKTLRKW